jgi:hypothetical protein
MEYRQVIFAKEEICIDFAYRVCESCPFYIKDEEGHRVCDIESPRNEDIVADYVKLKDTEEGMIEWITKWVIPTVDDKWKSIYNEDINDFLLKTGGNDYDN